MSRIVIVWITFKFIEFCTLVGCVLIGALTWSIRDGLFTVFAGEFPGAILFSIFVVTYYFLVMGYIPFSLIAFVVERRLVRTRLRASSVNFIIFLLHSSVVFVLLSVWDEIFIRSYYVLSWPLGLFLIYYLCKRVEQFMT